MADADPRSGRSALVEIRIGRYTCRTTAEEARQIVRDPARLLNLWDMLLEATHTSPDDP